MTADARRTEREDSRRTSVLRGVREPAVLARTALLAAGAAGALLLVLATFLTIIQVRVGTVSELEGFDTAISGGERHGAALVLLAVAAVPMLLGAWRGAGPAKAALAVLGAVALLLALVQDLPDADETGRIGTAYDDARAEVGPGFYAETLGGVLLLATGGGLLVLGGGRRASGGRPPRGRTPGGASSGRAAARLGRRAPDEQGPADDAP